MNLEKIYKKYRVKRVVLNNGEQIYTLQKRYLFFFWRNIYFPSGETCLSGHPTHLTMSTFGLTPNKNIKDFTFVRNVRDYIRWMELIGDVVCNSNGSTMYFAVKDDKGYEKYILATDIDDAYSLSYDYYSKKDSKKTKSVDYINCGDTDKLKKPFQDA